MAWTADGRFIVVTWVAGGASVVGVDGDHALRRIEKPQPFDRVESPRGSDDILTADRRDRIRARRGVRASPVRATIDAAAPTARLAELGKARTEYAKSISDQIGRAAEGAG